MISNIFTYRGHQPKARKNNENKAGYFEPQLPQSAEEVARRGSDGIQHCTISPGALYLLARNSRRNTQFSRSREVRHCSRFYQPQGLKWIGASLLQTPVNGLHLTVTGLRGIRGPATEAVDEGTGRSNQ